jgi:hypothetical protein
MTYLQLINKVLRELREKTVSDLAADYTLLIGQFVNEAKEEVERAWNWKALRTDITFNTVAATQDYSLGSGGVGSSATNDRSKLIYDHYGRPQLFVTTEPYERRMTEISKEIHREQIAFDEDDNGEPDTFSLKRTSSGITISIYPKPDAAYALQGTFYVPQDELTAAGTTISCPAEPVWKLALAYAASERGGGMGEAAGPLQARAERALWSAITEESELGELTMYEE